MTKKRHTFLRRIKRRKFGELLLSQGIISPEQLNEALELQRRDGGLLGDIMVAQKIITETEVVRSLSSQYNLPVLRTHNYSLDSELIQTFPPAFLYVNLILPINLSNGFLSLIAADVPDEPTLEELAKKAHEVVVFLSSKNDITNALLKHHPVSEDDRRNFVSIRRRRVRGEHIDLMSMDPKALRDKLEAEREPVMAQGGGENNAAQQTEVFEGPGAGGIDAEETALFSSLDSAWESVFDEAEKNLKQDDKES